MQNSECRGHIIYKRNKQMTVDLNTFHSGMRNFNCGIPSSGKRGWRGWSTKLIIHKDKQPELRDMQYMYGCTICWLSRSIIQYKPPSSQITTFLRVYHPYFNKTPGRHQFHLLYFHLSIEQRKKTVYIPSDSVPQYPAPGILDHESENGMAPPILDWLNLG